MQTILCRLPEGHELAEPYQDYLAELCADCGERDPARAEILKSVLSLSLKRGSKR